jgi:LPXTG-site transpeptidase (sortase) family protein
VTIFNPNAFQLTNASWTDNLAGVQPGIIIASPVNLSNSCGGSVTAVSGGTTLSLSGGTVPAQVGTTPGSCTVAVDVTSTTQGNLINTIPAGALTSTGGGVSITNTSPASATLNVGGVQPPTVAKSFSPSTIWAGQTSQLSIVITNNESNTTLTQASLTDNLPANVFLANPVSPTLSGCGGSASLSAVSGGTSLTLNNATIAPNSTCTIRVNVTSNTQGSYLNTIPANALQTQQGLTNTSPDSARLNVQEIGITKAFSPPSFAAGATSTLTITLQNPNNTPYTGVNVTDTLPGTVLTVVPGSATTTCGGTVSIAPPRTVSLTGGTIPAGSVTTPGTCTITFQVTAPAGTPSATYLNTIPAGAITTDQGVTNVRPATASVTIAGVDVTGIKSFSPSSIAPGGNSRLRIEIFAPGDTDLTNFSITDNLPAGLTVSNSTAPATSGCGATPPLVLTATTGATAISLTNGLILAGQRCRIDVYVTGSTSGVYTNTIPPTNITNNENRTPAGDLTANLTVGNVGNLSMALVKGFDPLTVFGGSASTMSILLINPNNVALTSIAFTDNMPIDTIPGTGMILANPLNFNVGTCGGTLSGTPGANTFSFSGGSLPPGSNCTLTLGVTMTVNGNLTNTIPANAVTTLEGVSNPDPAEASLTNLPGASVSKFFSPNPIAAGSYSLLTIAIQNTGNVALSGMGLIDNLPGNLPAGLVIANPPAPAPVNSCGGTLSAVAGTQVIQLTNGSLGASASCTIVVAVTGSTPGDYENNIPVAALRTDQSATNNSPAVDTLVVTGEPNGGGGEGGGGRRGAGGGNNTPDDRAVNELIIPLTGFAPNTVTSLDSSSHPAYEAMPLTLEIPVIKVKTSIAGVQLKKAGWDVSWLQDQAGWLNGTAYPTWKGNSVLTAHVVNADGKPGVFYGLKYLGVGEYAFVYNAGYRYTYKIVSNEFVQADDMTVLKHEEKSYLTLITCDSFDEKSGTYLRRVAVRAVLVDVREVK